MNRKQNARICILAIVLLATFGSIYGAKERLGDTVYTRTNPTATICISGITATFFSTGEFLTVTFASTIAGLCSDRHSIYVGE
jgi:hypothetical protein